MGIFIDFVALMLINMSAGLFVLAWFVLKGQMEENPRRWAAAFAVVGVIAAACGFRMAWTWPLPGPYNSAYGEMSIFLGMLFLGAALAVAMNWDLVPLGIVGFFAGLIAVVLGPCFISMRLSQSPLLTGIGFILTGLAGMWIGLAFHLKRSAFVRCVGALLLAGAALIWAVVGYPAYWFHMQSFKDWHPLIMQERNKAP